MCRATCSNAAVYGSHSCTQHAASAQYMEHFSLNSKCSLCLQHAELVQEPWSDLHMQLNAHAHKFLGQRGLVQSFLGEALQDTDSTLVMLLSQDF